MGTPAETVIRSMVLKHLRGWSYETLERECPYCAVLAVFGGVSIQAFASFNRTSTCSLYLLVQQFKVRVKSSHRIVLLQVQPLVH